MRQALACVLAAATYDALVGRACAGKITTSRPFLIDSTVADMQWVNSSLKDAKPNAKTVFVRSTLGSIYRSKDDGKNWVSQRDKFGSEDDEPYKTRIQQMIFSKADARYAIFKGYSENMWYTKDQGDTYQNHAFGVMMDIKTHSKQPEWLLASKFEGSFPDRYLSLFLSVDFGASWKKLVTHVYQFEWVRAPPSLLPRQSDTALRGFLVPLAHAPAAPVQACFLGCFAAASLNISKHPRVRNRAARRSGAAAARCEKSVRHQKGAQTLLPHVARERGQTSASGAR
jgi:hypothetical protein